MNYLITFIQEVRVILKQCFVRCIRQCLCFQRVQGCCPVLRSPKAPVKMSSWWATRWWQHLSQLYSYLGRMTEGGTDTSWIRWRAEVPDPRSTHCALQRMIPACVWFTCTKTSVRPPPIPSLGRKESAPLRTRFPTLPPHYQNLPRRMKTETKLGCQKERYSDTEKQRHAGGRGVGMRERKTGG